MSSGPYLYDDGPTSPHTGVGRPRRGLLVAILLGTVLVAVGMAVALPLVKGSAQEQATAAVTVFYDSLADGDVDTATQLLCRAERTRLAGADLVAEYGRPGEAEVTGVRAAEVDGAAVQRVTVRWRASGTASVTVVNEEGPHVCGIAEGG